ncbi:MAG: hypothetical protein V4857_16485 [Pseudomonadota bacterium]
MSPFARLRPVPLFAAFLARCFSVCLAVSLAPAAIAAAPAKADGPGMLVRFAGAGPNAGRIDIVDAARGKLRQSLALRCDRVHYGAGVIACLRSVAGQGLKLDLADRSGTPSITLGFPNVLLASRVRVARDGSFAAFTGFSAGHSYSGTDFSTRTYLIDVVRKRLVADLSTFKVVETDSLKLPAKRINVWGVTFDPKGANHFMATVGAAGQVFLAKGDATAKTLTLLRAEIECPSYSPDGKRLAFKRRNGTGGWFPAVLDIASGRETVMHEVRSVDDQIEWVSNNVLVYELARPTSASGSAVELTDLVTRKADGQSKSALLLPEAGSPSVFD